MYKICLYVVAFLRIIVPPFLFFFPIPVTVISGFGDAIDGYLANKSGWLWNKYNRYDKILDWWWYIFIMLYFIGKPEFILVLVLFLHRSIGQAWCLITNHTKYLVWFPNIIENYFYFYLGNSIFHLPIFNQQITLILSGFAFGMIREYVAHVKKISLSKYWGLGVNWKSLEN
jgi:phosphatidylglycerophosphate synthase